MTLYEFSLRTRQKTPYGKDLKRLTYCVSNNRKPNHELSRGVEDVEEHEWTEVIPSSDTTGEEVVGSDKIGLEREIVRKVTLSL